MKDMKDLLNFSLINIDKSAGPTSYSVSEFIRRQLNLKKTSHMGTLDPKVTGVLPVTLGRACKLAGYFIKHDKTYVGVLETHKEQDIEKLQELIDDNFTGKIKQTPPHRSAVKVQEREREVYFWKLLEVGSALPEEFDSLNRKGSSQSAPPQVPSVEGNGEVHAKRGGLSNKGRSFLFETRVEGGTYIRKLCSDLGDMIGGAHMGELRRTRAGVFSEAMGDGQWELGTNLVNLHDFRSAVGKWKDTLANSKENKAGAGPGDDTELKKMLVPAEDAIKKVLPVVEVDKCAIKSLHIGKPLFTNNVVVRGDGQLVTGNDGKELKAGDVFALFCGKQFVGIYKKTDEEITFGRSEYVYN